MSLSSFESLDALLSKLPFHVDDVAAVNAYFARWFTTESEDDRFVVDLWTYCFIYRYFLIKLLQEASIGAADLDELVDRTFLKIEGSASQIKQPTHYAHWVSVVCKNTFLNFLRDRRQAVSLDEGGGSQIAAEPGRVYGDVMHVRLALHRAIERLPHYLRDCVRLRLLDGLTYDEISERTGFPLPRIRSYVNKAMKKFREDDRLLAHLYLDG